MIAFWFKLNQTPMDKLADKDKHLHRMKKNQLNDVVTTQKHFLY